MEKNDFFYLYDYDLLLRFIITNNHNKNEYISHCC
jgi:hypothetical protein